MVEGVRTSTAITQAQTRPRPKRSRFGYQPQWWGEAGRPRGPESSYWRQTRRPLPCLVFVLPVLIVYEAGVAWLGGSAGARTGADAWMRQGLAGLGLTDRWLPPLALIVSLLTWQAFGRREWRFRPRLLLGMAAESMLMAVALVGLSKLVDLGFVRLEGRPMTLAAAAHPLAPLVGYLGAGVYEEALFRLALVPALYGSLRLLQAPAVLAGTVAVTGSALVFSIAHHAGAPGEAFTWFAFIFRWLAGVYFAWVFVARGFGVAVGTHAAYDVLVGWLGWSF